MVEQERASINLIKAEKAQSLETTKLKIKTKQLNQETKKQALEQLGLISPYQKVVAKMNEAGRVIQNLNAKRFSGQKLSDKEQKELRESSIQFRKYQTAVLKADKSIGRFQRNVGNYPKALRTAAGAARSLASALGLVGGAFLVVNTLKNAIGVVKDFEKANATLSGILQVEKEEMEGLTDEAIRLGSVTVKTAGEVTQLQIAYARLGFSQNEIINLTEATIQGSIALNSELDKTANLVGAVVNTFDNFSSVDAPEILDVMALATAKSALNFEKLEKGLPIVGGAANAAGIPFTKLVALLGKLADSGIDVSSSSTALRNIFIESSKQGLNYSQIIEKIKSSQDKLTTANDEFGKRAAVSATVLAANIDATDQLDKSLQNAAGTAESMAKKELNTLDGALQLLRSAWEGYLLETNESTGASNKLKEAVQFLAANLHKIINTTIAVTKTFVVYKGIVSILSKRKTILKALTIAYTFSLTAMNKGIVATVRSLKIFRVVLANTGFGAALVAIGAIVAAFIKWRNEMAKINKQAKITQDRINKVTKEVRDERRELNLLVNSITNTNTNQTKRNSLIKELYEKYPQFNKYIKDEETNNTNLKKALKLANDEYIKKLAIKRLEAKLDIKGAQEKVADAILNTTNKTGDYSDALDIIQKELELVGIKTNKATGSLENRSAVLKKLINQEKSRIIQAKANGRATENEINNIAVLDNFITTINQRRKKSIRATSEESTQKNKLQLLEEEVIKTKERYGLVTKETNDIILDEIVLIGKSAEAKKQERAENQATIKQRLAASQELSEFDIKEQIKRLNQTISNEKNANFQIIDALRERTRLEIDLAKMQSKFAIESKNLTGNQLLLAEKQLQSKLIDIALKSQKEISKIKKRDESDTTPLEDEFDIGFDTRLHLIEQLVKARVGTFDELAKLYDEDREAFLKLAENEFDIGFDTRLHLIEQLEKAGVGTFDELAKLYDEDREAFLKLAEEKLNITSKFSQKQFDIISEQFNRLGELYGIDASKFTVLFDGKKNTTEDWVDASAEAVQGMYNMFSTNYNDDLEAVRKNAEYSLKLAGDNAEAREEIQRQLAEKEKKIRAKQMQQDKDAALFSIFINTAAGIIKTIANVGLLKALPTIALITALGAAQAAAVASKEIPAYEKGTKSALKTTDAVIDEKGPEIHTDSMGRLKSFGQNKGARITKVEKGDKIYTAMQSKKIMSDIYNLTNLGQIMFDSSLLNIPTISQNNGHNNFNDSRILDGLIDIKNAINNRTGLVINFDEMGMSKHIIKGNIKKEILNSRLTGRGYDV